MKKEMLDKLFDLWQEEYSRIGLDRSKFSKDGIIDEAMFNNANKKLLFVLRESNTLVDSGLLDLYKNGPKWTMAAQLSKWAMGILDGFPEFDKVDMDYNRRSEVMQSIALLNIKKIAGGPKADFNLLNAYSMIDKEYIRHEIDIIAPDIIICCSTFIELMWALDLTESAIKIAKTTMNTAMNTGDIFKEKYSYKDIRIIAWPHHPSDRKSHKKNYEELRDYFKQYKEKMSIL